MFSACHWTDTGWMNVLTVNSELWAHLLSSKWQVKGEKCCRLGSIGGNPKLEEEGMNEKKQPLQL